MQSDNVDAHVWLMSGPIGKQSIIEFTIWKLHVQEPIAVVGGGAGVGAGGGAGGVYGQGPHVPILTQLPLLHWSNE